MYVGLKQPRGDGERYVTPARAAAKETNVTAAFVILSVCWDGSGSEGGGGGVGQTDLVMKGSEIASHHGGSGHKRS